MANNPHFPGVQPPPPPIAGSMDPTRNFAPPMSVQFRHAVPSQQPQQFVPMAPQPFHHASRGVPGMGAGFPLQTQQPQYTPLVQQLPVRGGQPGLGPAAQQPIPVQPMHSNMHVASGPPRPQPNAQTPSNYTHGVGPPGSHLSSSYTFASSYGQVAISTNAVPQYQSMNQVHAPGVPAGSHMGVSGSQSNAPLTPLQQTNEQPSVTTTTVSVPSIQSKSTEEAPTDWIEHTSAKGRKYYYNKRTRQSSWEKPWVLMTPVERADSSTNWKEFTSPDGRKYYFNKVTNQSTWSIPEELKLAREQLEKGSAKATQSAMFSYISTSAPSAVIAPAGFDASSATINGVASSPVPVAPAFASSSIEPKVISGPSTSPIGSSSVVANADEAQSQTTSDAAAASPAAASDVRGVSVTIVNTNVTPMDDSGNASVQDALGSKDGVTLENAEGKEIDGAVVEKVDNVMEEKAADQEPLTYANKLDAKNAFKALLESLNVGSDWTWDQAMRVIINDKRYGALRTLGERKQAFNEFLAQKKKQEAEDRRNKQKMARDEYRRMLEESTELTSSTKWSKVQTMFEDDERFEAIEREKDRKDMFENYIEELKQKERVKAQEERRRSITEYRKFLESCDFIKASSQWRKVQDRLESDERCSCLDKMDRLEIFQEYLRDLEKEEEEQRKIQKEELRKAERKNRDEFRKLMEDHVASGTITAKTYWRDYCTMVKDLPAFVAVASNTSGSTPKYLFEDLAEELQKQYHVDKARVKDAVKLKKVSISSTWTLDDLKAAILEDVGSPSISDVNFKLIFDDLLERAKEKEEKEAKKRKRLADAFSNLLHSIKELNSSSIWENSKYLFESCQEFSSIGDESICRDIFEEYVTHLKEEAKENEQRRKEEKAKKEKDREERERRKAKHGREKGREREKDEYIKDGETDDVVDIDDSIENKRSGRDDDRKHRKRHRSSADDLNESEKDQTKHSHRHRSDHRKSKRHESSVESDSETRHKRHRREHQNGSHRSGDQEELEDGEFGEERESR